MSIEAREFSLFVGKQLSGIYYCRVKTPTLEGCEVVINGFRVGFSTMKDVFKIHRNDGYSYGAIRSVET